MSTKNTKPGSKAGQRGRPRAQIRLGEDERARLQSWARQRSTGQALALRARIILESAGGKPDSVVAAQLGVSSLTVSKWRRRYIRHRARGLEDAPRAGAPRRLGDLQTWQLIIRTITERPREATHWTTRRLAEEFGVSQSTVSRIWHKFGLQPWRQDTFRLVSDTDFQARMLDIVGLYLDLPLKAFALCLSPRNDVAEAKSPRRHRQGGQALRRATLAQTERCDEQFIALGHNPGMHGPPERGGSTRSLMAFIGEVSARTPRGPEIHIVLDDHLRRPSLLAWLVRRPRIRLHFTPQPVAWIHAIRTACRWIGQRQAALGIASSTPPMTEAIAAGLKAEGPHLARLVWLRPAAEIELLLARQIMMRT